MVPNPLSQSDAYTRTLRALGTHVRVARIGDQGRCLIQTRRLPLIGAVNLISQGPLGLPPDAAADYLHALDVTGPLIVNTASSDLPMRGYLRLVAPKHHARLTLGPPDQMRAALHQNWRNALIRAKRAQLRISNTPYCADQHRWITDADRAQQKANHYRNWPVPFLNCFAQENPGHARVITAHDGTTPIAAMLYLCHQPWATYHLGVTTAQGRRANAHTLTLWHMMLWLAARDYSVLDLGLLNGSPGLDRFKLRTGATRHPLGGTWLRLPRPFRRQLPSIHAPSGQKA